MRPEVQGPVRIDLGSASRADHADPPSARVEVGQHHLAWLAGLAPRGRQQQRAVVGRVLKACEEPRHGRVARHLHAQTIDLAARRREREANNAIRHRGTPGSGRHVAIHVTAVGPAPYELAHRRAWTETTDECARSPATLQLARGSAARLRTKRCPTGRTMTAVRSSWRMLRKEQMRGLEGVLFRGRFLGEECLLQGRTTIPAMSCRVDTRLVKRPCSTATTRPGPPENGT